MTREEAIKWLEAELRIWESDCKSKHGVKDALNMAIQALSQEPCDFVFEIDYKTDVGRIIFSDKTEKRVNMGAIMDFSEFKLAKKAYECGKAEALQQKPCTDAVSRGVFEQVMREHDIAIEQLHELGYEFGQKIEPCDDAVSRDAVLQAVSEGCQELRGVYGRCEELINELPFVKSQEPKTGHCKECKWWKDSDGVYRRGVGAESKCPINNVSVNHGFGYCYMFEPQERSEE